MEKDSISTYKSFKFLSAEKDAGSCPVNWFEDKILQFNRSLTLFIIHHLFNLPRIYIGI